MAYVEIYKRPEPTEPEKPARIRVRGASYECVVEVADAPDGYGGARHRALLTALDHNREHPDDPWWVEEEADEKVVEVAKLEAEASK